MNAANAVATKLTQADQISMPSAWRFGAGFCTGNRVGSMVGMVCLHRDNGGMIDAVPTQRIDISQLSYTRGSGRPEVLDGTFTQASPSSTTSPSTAQVQVSRARNFSGINSATVTTTSTVSPILTGPRKFSVCEI